MAPEMPPLIITATPNKSWLNPELAYPEAIADVAAEAERCVAGGASILHLHSVSEWVPLIAAVGAVRRRRPGPVRHVEHASRGPHGHL